MRQKRLIASVLFGLLFQQTAWAGSASNTQIVPAYETRVQRISLQNVSPDADWKNGTWLDFSPAIPDALQTVIRQGLAAHGWVMAAAPADAKRIMKITGIYRSTSASDTTGLKSTLFTQELANQNVDGAPDTISPGVPDLVFDTRGIRGMNLSNSNATSNAISAGQAAGITKSGSLGMLGAAAGLVVNGVSAAQKNAQLNQIQTIRNTTSIATAHAGSPELWHEEASYTIVCDKHTYVVVVSRDIWPGPGKPSSLIAALTNNMVDYLTGSPTPVAVPNSQPDASITATPPVIADTGSNATLAHSADPNGMLKTAIRNPSLTEKFWLDGPLADRLRQQTQAPASTNVLLTISTVKVFRPGCSRMRMWFQEPDHLMKTVKGDMEPFSVYYDLNICTDGKPPALSKVGLPE